MKQDELKGKVKAKFGHVVYKGAKEYSDFVTYHLTYAIERDFGKQTVFFSLILIDLNIGWWDTYSIYILFS